MLIRSRATSLDPAVELTPIIDMVFLLLIFFLVATTFQQTEREMSVTLPQSKHGGPITMSLRELVINVLHDGAMVVSGRPVVEEELGTIIRTALESNPKQKVTVRGDQAASYAAIARALDVVKGAGVQEPYLDTVPARSGAGS